MKSKITDQSSGAKSPSAFELRVGRSKEKRKDSRFNVRESSRKLKEELAKLREEEILEKIKIAETREKARKDLEKNLTKINEIIELFKAEGITKELENIKLMHDNITYFMDSPENMAFIKHDDNDSTSYVKASRDLFIEAGKVKFITKGFAYISITREQRETILNKLDEETKVGNVKKDKLAHFFVNVNNIDKDADNPQRHNIIIAVKKYLKDEINANTFMGNIKSYAGHIARYLQKRQPPELP